MKGRDNLLYIAHNFVFSPFQLFDQKSNIYSQYLLQEFNAGKNVVEINCTCRYSFWYFWHILDWKSGLMILFSVVFQRKLCATVTSFCILVIVNGNRWKWSTHHWSYRVFKQIKFCIFSGEYVNKLTCPISRLTLVVYLFTNLKWRSMFRIFVTYFLQKTF